MLAQFATVSDIKHHRSAKLSRARRGLCVRCFEAYFVLPAHFALDIMLRRLKKFAVYSSVIVAGQASRALDDAPFAGQDESEDAKGLLRRLSECEDASYVQIFDQCIDRNTTKLRVHPASPTPGAARDLDVTGTSATTCSARSRPRSACSRR